MTILSEDDMEELRNLVSQIKMAELFEEPSTYEDEDDDEL